MVAAPKLTFDPELHRYTINGIVVPSVTQIIRPITPRYDGEGGAAYLGTLVHEACEHYLAGDLEEWALDPLVAGYLEGFKRWREDVPGWLVEQAEWMLGDERLLFAGRLDLLMDTYDRTLGRHLAVVDIKTGSSIGPEVGVQLAGYQLLAQRAVGSARKVTYRYALQLKEDGTYVLHPFTDPSDGPEFRALLTHYRWKELHGQL